MSKARQNRLNDAEKWLKTQEITADFHVVKAYRKRYNVDKTCAMRELCMLHVLSPEKQSVYEKQLKSKGKRRKSIPAENTESLPWQDENFGFIAGYTSGGAPYGIPWDEDDSAEDEKPVSDISFDQDDPF